MVFAPWFKQPEPKPESPAAPPSYDPADPTLLVNVFARHPEPPGPRHRPWFLDYELASDASRKAAFPATVKK